MLFLSRKVNARVIYKDGARPALSKLGEKLLRD